MHTIEEMYAAIDPLPAMLSPDLKIFNSSGEYIGCLKHFEDAACIVASYGIGAEVRFGHTKKMTLWREGQEEFSAGESYDRAANIMRERNEVLWGRAAAKGAK
jgi:hypothetical protein